MQGDLSTAEPRILLIEDDGDYAYILHRMLTHRDGGALPLERVDCRGPPSGARVGL